MKPTPSLQSTPFRPGKLPGLNTPRLPVGEVQGQGCILAFNLTACLALGNGPHQALTPFALEEP